MLWLKLSIELLLKQKITLPQQNIHLLNIIVQSFVTRSLIWLCNKHIFNLYYPILIFNHKIQYFGLIVFVYYHK